jgi:hypothetical protein
MAKTVPVEVRITDLPQFQQFVSSVATLLGVLAREGGDLPELAYLDEDRIRDAMAGAMDHPGRTITR